MNDLQIEQSREAVFKDSVLSAAEANSVQIVAEATKKMEEELKVVRQHYESLSYETIAQKYSLDTEREFSQATQAARKDLLLYRAELVDGIFESVEQNLHEFVKSGDYLPWLVKHLKQHLPLENVQEELVIYLRKEDMHFEKEMKKELAGCKVLQVDTIRIGGLKLRNGHIMYDETLDELLRAEREKFINNKELTVK